MVNSTNDQKRSKTFFLLVFRLAVSAIFLTCRKRYQGTEHLESLIKAEKNWIFSFWHNNITTAIWILKNRKLISLISASRDGELAARLIEKMGNLPVRGSSSRGGVKALLKMIRLLKQGSNGAITPDGPRGPKYKLQSGAITLAQKSGLPLIPLHIESTRQWIFHKSWDRHKIPKPFSTIVVCYGKPIYIPKSLKGDSIEKARIDFEREMMKNVESTKAALKNLKRIL